MFVVLDVCDISEENVTPFWQALKPVTTMTLSSKILDISGSLVSGRFKKRFIIHKFYIV